MVTGEEGEAGRRQQARVTVTDGAEAFALASSSCVACAARYCRVTEPRPNRQALLFSIVPSFRASASGHAFYEHTNELDLSPFW